MTVKIDKDTPPPVGHHRVKYPFAEMEIGDSFLMTNKDGAWHAHKAGKRLGRKFTTRTVEGGVRVWRVA